MAGWSFLLCYLDHECRPFGIGQAGNNETTLNYSDGNNNNTTTTASSNATISF